MVKWLLAWRRETSIRKPWEDILSLFDFAEEESSDGLREKYHVKRSGLVFDLKFEWVVEPGDEAIRVQEDAYISGVWFLLLSLALVGSVSSLGIGLNSEGVYNLVFSAGSVLLFVVFLLLVLRAFEYRGPMNEFLSSQPDHSSYHPLLSLILSVFVVLMPGLWLKGVLLQISVLLVGAFCVLYYWFLRKVENYSIRWQKRYEEFLKGFPMIASDYVLMLVSLSLPVILFVLVADLRVFQLLISGFPYLAPLIYSFSTVVLFSLVVVGVLKELHPVGRSRFESTGGNISGKTAAVTGAIVFSTSLGFIFLCYLFVGASSRFLTAVDALPAIGVVFASAIPILFLLTGFCYQIWSFSSDLYLLVTRMEKQELSTDYNPEVDTFVLDDPGYFIGAGTFLWKDFIVVSRQVLTEFEEDELGAILAHEECHILEGDSRLAMLVAVLSPLCGVGRNVAYAVLDYRGREFRADRFAVERTGSDQLRSALEKMQILSAKSSMDKSEFDEISPTLTPAFGDGDRDITSIFQRYYGFFFGNFAFVRAHPSLSERIDNLSRT